MDERKNSDGEAWQVLLHGQLEKVISIEKHCLEVIEDCSHAPKNLAVYISDEEKAFVC